MYFFFFKSNMMFFKNCLVIWYCCCLTAPGPLIRFKLKATVYEFLTYKHQNPLETPLHIINRGLQTWPHGLQSPAQHSVGMFTVPWVLIMQNFPITLTPYIDRCWALDRFTYFLCVCVGFLLVLWFPPKYMPAGELETLNCS